MKKPKIVFMGTPEFSVPSLEAIHDKYGVSLVITVPDKQQGRGLKLSPSPVKVKALELGIPVLQPAVLKEESFINELKELAPDIIVVIAFRILPKEIFTIPCVATFNIHGSLLPKYRGAAPINWAIINGENTSGLTSFIIQEKVDTGNMLLTKMVDIDDEMTAGDLHDKLMPLSAVLSLETIELLLSGNFQPIKQNDPLSCPAPKLTKDNTKINWTDSAANVKRFIRGLSPYPTSWTKFDGEVLKVFLVKFSTESYKLEPGEYYINDNRFIVGCSDGNIELLSIQPQNKKRMLIRDFINGYRGNCRGRFT
ncbi:methionyl-tRNA formyltransferase [Candidatus Kapaibacterium sp.]